MLIGKFHFAILVRSAWETSPWLGPHGPCGWGSPHPLVCLTLLTLCGFCLHLDSVGLYRCHLSCPRGIGQAPEAHVPKLIEDESQ